METGGNYFTLKETVKRKRQDSERHRLGRLAAADRKADMRVDGGSIYINRR